MYKWKRELAVSHFWTIDNANYSIFEQKIKMVTVLLQKEEMSFCFRNNDLRDCYNTVRLAEKKEGHK
jgi:hypothetical protein